MFSIQNELEAGVQSLQAKGKARSNTVVTPGHGKTDPVCMVRTEENRNRMRRRAEE